MRVNAIDGFDQDLAHLRAALDASCIVGTWDWDHVRGVVVYDEGAARLLTGDPELAERELHGRSAAAAVHLEDQEWLAEHMRRATRKGGLVLAEYRVVAADGSIRWLLNRGRTHQDDMGQPSRSRGILVDITEVRDGSGRYVLSEAPKSQDPLLRAADLALTLKQTLGDDTPPDVQAAMNLMLFCLGRAIGQR